MESLPRCMRHLVLAGRPLGSCATTNNFRVRNGASMTLIAFMGDCHIGNHKKFGGPTRLAMNVRCGQTIEAFSNALNAAFAHRVFAVVVLGDLFDTSRPPPQMICAVGDAIAEANQNAFSKREPPRIVIVTGNHDADSDDSGDNALVGLSQRFENVDCVDTPQHIYGAHAGSTGLLPFRHGNARQWVPVGLTAIQESIADSRIDGALRIIGLHAGIVDSQSHAWLRDSPDAIEAGALFAHMEACGASAAFAANHHTKRRWSTSAGPKDTRDIVQVGALCPTGFDNPGLDYGAVWFYDVESKLPAFETVRGPRFLVAKSAAWLADTNNAIRDFITANVLPEHRYLRIVAPREQLSHAVTRIVSLRESNQIRDGEALVDAGDTRAAAQQAATLARASDTLSAALAEYVGAMPLDEGVDRASVLSQVRGYLGVT